MKPKGRSPRHLFAFHLFGPALDFRENPMQYSRLREGPSLEDGLREVVTL